MSLLSAPVKERQDRAPDTVPLVVGNHFDEAHSEQPKVSWWRHKFRTAFGVAFCCFVLINALLSFTTPFKFDPYRYVYRGWAWWTMHDLLRSPGDDNVAMLGSSLMVSAVAGCDANYLNKPLDLTKYHKVSYLEDRLRDTFGGNFHIFNLSAPGQMPSDAYLMLKAMIATSNRPDVVIYGVAPRDFVDSTLSGPNDTEPFKYLTRIVNIDEVANAEFRSLWGKLDWCLQRVTYLYTYSLDIRMAFADVCDAAFNIIAPRPYTNHPFTWWDRVRIMPQYIPGEIHPEAVISSPLTKDKITFTDNTKEYQKRYHSPDKETYHTQMYFLRKLAEYCHRERIELVVVNMPLTFYNTRMLPPGVYEKYVAALREFAWNHSICFYDLCDFKNYTQEDFHDTVHLNAFGARKFFDALLASLKTDPRASTALSLSGLTLEKHLALKGWRPTY
jgi:hypothetical protein